MKDGNLFNPRGAYLFTTIQAKENFAHNFSGIIDFMHAQE